MTHSYMELTSIPKRSFMCCLAGLVGCYTLTIYAGVFDQDLFISLLSEDGPLENIATIFILIASILFALAYIRYKPGKPYFFLFLSIILLFVFFEEISWGQRLFNIATPDSFKSFNAQNEINLHNYKPIYKYVNGVVYVCFYIYMIGIPLLILIFENLHSFLMRFNVPLPSPATAFLAFLNYFLYTYPFLELLQNPRYHGLIGIGINFGELLETGIELTLLFFAFECFNRGITWMKQ
jgi:hypothetical protein